jgi:hypothetical protein
MMLIPSSSAIRGRKAIKNEKGYTLILVMIIITVIFIFAMSLSGMAISTRMQFNKTDNRNKATDLAEMGVTYYQSILTKFVSSANVTANQKTTDYINTQKPDDAHITQFFNDSFTAELTSKLSSQPIQNTVENGNYFEVAFTRLDTFSDKFIVNFTSKGTTQNEPVTITGAITIRKSAQTTRNGEPKPSPSAFAYTEMNPINLQSKIKVASYNTSTYFSQSVQIQGKRFLTVKGDAYFLQELNFQGAANITINGDAIFEKAIVFPNGTPYTFCVYGNTYLVDSNKLKSYPIPQNTCSNPTSREWSIDLATGTKIQYSN